ncbi:uncharacterized protein Bfra_012327 [Botrytis fragariae]|uniref:Uncharacterized protein n=1 Tax=Botrytis fragariae TaxID=1964551 RepID=A0A8H6AIS6_9HELO|nr:uncharacterized protein Bfra_012327 [Botrytis fragariae]KAF5868417.1 hypothetical protein Bfra_012327 [Botrytis fragariae]
MASLLSGFRTGFRSIPPRAYENISRSNHHDSDTEDIETKTAEVGSMNSRSIDSISRFHAICLYTLSLVLAVALAITLLGEAADCDGPLGSYERGFKTEIRPDRNTLALKKVKFYGGFVYDENGTASLTQPPGPDYFGIPGRETDHHWNLDLKGMFQTTIDLLLFHRKTGLRKRLSSLKETLCMGPYVWSKFFVIYQNYIRMSLSPEWYFGPAADPDPQRPLEMHLKHCLLQIHQLLKCQLDMTPIPRTELDSGLRIVPEAHLSRGTFSLKGTHE